MQHRGEQTSVPASGADASASWWQRNFRMYALIQQHAQPGARDIAIGGQGHTAASAPRERRDGPAPFVVVSESGHISEPTRGHRTARWTDRATTGLCES